MSSRNRLCVLVAEDDLSSREMLDELLTFLGCEVTTVTSAAGAQRHTAHTDLALIDIGLPDQSGHTVAAHFLKTYHPHERPYLVALTGRAAPEDRSASLAAGFDEHLTKPLSLTMFQQLLARVRQKLHVAESPDQR